MFAVEDGYGGVLCTDGAVVSAQLVENFGKAVRLWASRIDAERSGLGVFDKLHGIKVDENGHALA